MLVYDSTQNFKYRFYEIEYHPNMVAGGARQAYQGRRPFNSSCVWTCFGYVDIVQKAPVPNTEALSVVFANADERDVREVHVNKVTKKYINKKKQINE